MLADLKYALRQAAKHPGFALVVVLILALGIGSNTAVFTAVDALLLRGLPVRDPQQLALVGAEGVQGFPGRLEAFSYPAYQNFRDHARSLTDIIALNNGIRLASVIPGSGQNNTVPVQVDEVSGNFFSSLGVAPVLGRTLTPDDDRDQAPHAVVVLSHAYWQRAFGGDPSVLGRTILLENAAFSVVGIAPPGFFGVAPGSRTDLWLPLQAQALIAPAQSAQFQTPFSFWLHLMVRVRPGVAREAAAADLDLLFQAELASEGLFRSPTFEKLKKFGRIDLQPGGSGFLSNPGQISRLLTILLVVTGFVLVVACANVASLLQARMAARQRELAVRMALGAGRGRIVSQLLTESLLLAAAGGALGLLVAHWGTQLLFNYLPGGQTLDLSPDGRILCFVALLSAATAVCIGLIPSLRVSRLGLMGVLKSQGQSVTGGSQRIGKALVVGQIALSVCLLAGAGLFVRTLENLKNVDLGFRRDDLLLVNVGVDKHYTDVRRTAVIGQVLAGLAAMPGVRNATVSLGGLLDRSLVQAVAVDGYVPQDNEVSSAHFSFVGPGYFETVGTPILRGREFNDVERLAAANVPQPSSANAVPSAPKTPAAIGAIVINEAFARKYFGTADPIGHLVRPGIGAGQPDRVVGVVQDTVYDDLRIARTPEFYLPYSVSQAGSGSTALAFQVHTTQDPLSLTADIRAVVQRIDPKASVNFRTMADRLDNKLSQERLVARLSSSFSLFALLLASLGLYGVLAFNVAQRTREIGVRMALGAQMSRIIALIVKQGLALALAGCAIGAVAAAGLSRLIASSLYGVPGADPVTFLGVVVLLLAVALIACWLPARRASRVDPMIALRAE